MVFQNMLSQKMLAFQVIRLYPPPSDTIDNVAVFRAEQYKAHIEK